MKKASKTIPKYDPWEDFASALAVYVRSEVWSAIYPGNPFDKAAKNAVLQSVKRAFVNCAKWTDDDEAV